MEPILIKISGSQNFNGEEQENSVELTSEGFIEHTKDGVEITYEESELTGMKGTTTKITVERAGIITLNRSGTTNSCLVFEEGKKNLSYYETAEGAFSVSVYANYLEADINRMGGTIELDYTLEVDGAVVGENELSISFTYA